MQDYIEYKIKDRTLVNEDQPNVIRIYPHDKKWKLKEDIEKLKDSDIYEDIPLTKETKEKFKEFYIKKFFEIAHTKLIKEKSASEFEYKDDMIHEDKDDFDWVSFKCFYFDYNDEDLKQDDTESFYFSEPLYEKQLPIDFYKRLDNILQDQTEMYFGLKKDQVSDGVINEKQALNFIKNNKTKIDEIINFYVKNLSDDKDAEQLNKNDKPTQIFSNLRLISKTLRNFSKDVNHFEQKEGTIIDFFAFRDFSIDVFSSRTLDENIYQQYKKDKDLDQLEANSIQLNPELQQDIKLICFSKYDINRLFGDNETLNKIMEL